MNSLLSLRPSHLPVRIPSPSLFTTGPSLFTPGRHQYRGFAVSGHFISPPKQTRIRKPAASSAPHSNSKNNEEEFWIKVEDPLIADLMTTRRKYVSALPAKVNVDAAVKKFRVEVAEKDPLWSNLLAESKAVKKLEWDYILSKLNYMTQKMEKRMSRQDMEEKLFKPTMDYETDGGQLYSEVVTKWVVKYGASVFQVEDDGGDAA